jgi:hypothetical protein
MLPLRISLARVHFGEQRVALRNGERIYHLFSGVYLSSVGEGTLLPAEFPNAGSSVRIPVKVVIREKQPLLYISHAALGAAGELCQKLATSSTFGCGPPQSLLVESKIEESG